jgi:hypothetical protein
MGELNQNSVVFCVTCKGRLQHLARTLPRNLEDNPGARFVVLDYACPDDLTTYFQNAHWLDIGAGQLIVYQFPEAGSFKMAHAKNVAHRLGALEGGEILVNLDADNFTGPGFADYLVEQFRENPNSFMWSKMVKDGDGRLPRGISGRIAVTRDAFLIAGGYDEQFNTWSPDDKDFNLRLQRLGYEAREIDGKYLDAIRHNDKMRFHAYPESKNSGVNEDGQGDFDAVHESDNTVANFGHFGLAKVFRNFSPHAFRLDPIPTRIFGIGLHKTATTSLHAALKILGFDSAHWKNAHWAKAIWEEMRSGFRSLTVEKHYALVDLPIPLLFKELDQAYPGSKFILTVRSEGKWIRSVRSHWDPERNRFRTAWNTDPFTHRIHKELYGQKGFDEAVFLDRYRRHSREVLDYFAYRPADLLVMNMDAGAGWPELCGFLGKPVPGIPYPVEFETRG